MKTAEILKQWLNGESLSREQAHNLLSGIFKDEYSEIQIAGLLTALAYKGPSVEELVGFLDALDEAKTEIRVSDPDKLIDTCGMGGDNSGSINVSTLAAIVAAAAGAKVAKHGNRAASSKTGSADLLEALGIKIVLDKSGVEACIEELGIGFMFAPAFHPSMAKVAPVRRELAIATVFNLLGPLSNPANVKRQLFGVSKKEHLELISEVIKIRGADHVLVVFGSDGLDEISISAESYVREIKSGDAGNIHITAEVIEPRKYGYKLYDKALIKGGDPKENARITQEVLSGVEGPYLDIVLLNAGACIYVAGLVDDIRDGIALAKNTVIEKKALNLLDKWRALSQKL
jgi:anthranilate phosphoribosyltransferase